MPSLDHEAPLVLLREDPRLAAILAGSLGIALPPGYTARPADSDMTAALPAQFLTDHVVLLIGEAGVSQEERARRKKQRARNAGQGELAIIVEIQLRYDEEKFWTWPAYLTLGRAQYLCDTILIVICPDPAEASKCRQAIATGHPGFTLAPLVIDRTTSPFHSPAGGGGEPSSPEAAVLGVLTGAVDLETSDQARHQVLRSLTGLTGERLKTYTVFIRHAVSGQTRQLLEDLMTTTPYRDTFVERLEAIGEARGVIIGEAKGVAIGEARGEAKRAARMLLRTLKARGLQVPDKIRKQVRACTDLAQFDTWGDRAATATSIADVFGEDPDDPQDNSDSHQGEGDDPQGEGTDPQGKGDRHQP